MSDKIKKYFGLSNWAIDNPTTVWVIIIGLLTAGIFTYVNMPKEDFPEIIMPTIYVSSVYPGNSAEDIEKLVTKPLEDEIKNITGVGDITSESLQDFSIITVEWDNDSITPEEAKRKVKDKIDQVTVESTWPSLDTGGPVQPNAFDLNMSEQMPIININLTGESYTAQQLKNYAKYLQDKIEAVSEVKEAAILGVDDKEVEVALDLYKMNAANISMGQVIGAIQQENKTISGGNVIQNGQRTNLRVVGEIKHPSDLEKIIVGGNVRIRDIAKINFKEVDKTTYARNYGNNVVMLNVTKKSGKNLLAATDQVNQIIVDARKVLPQNLNIEITGDSSNKIRNQVSELENSIIFGVLLVVGVLMFFLGFKNSIFVGIAIPLSMLLSFVLLPRLGPMITGSNISLNTMTLFALIMGLGMLVDNGIVVVENVYRKLSEGLSKNEAAKQGVGEIAWPIIASTATTLAVFFPLGMWPGMMGKFMIYFPVTLSMVLASSLFVALVINSMLTAQFMNVDEKKMSLQSLIFISFLFLIVGGIFTFFAQKAGDTLVQRNQNVQILKMIGGVLAAGGAIVAFIGWLLRKHSYLLKIGLYVIGGGLFFILSSNLASNPETLQLFGSLFLIIGVFMWLFRFILTPMINFFQNKVLPFLERAYGWVLGLALYGRYVSIIVVVFTFGLLMSAFVLMGKSGIQTLFFPDNIPNQAIVYIEYPEGTDIEKTNALTSIIEKRVFKVVNKFQVTSSDENYGYLAKEHGENYNRLVESVVSQVGQGANNPNEGSTSNELPHKGKITVQFREFRYRDGTNTQDVVDEIRTVVQGIPGAIVTVEKDSNGPPAGPPINLELKGNDYNELLATAKQVRKYIQQQNISGIEELKIDINTNKPEMEIYVDREKAGRLGVSTVAVGSALRQSIYGWEASTYKPKGDDEDYKINVRLNEKSRYNIDALLNQKITFQNNMGQLMTVPISTVTSTRNTSTFNKIKRINSRRVVTVYSNVLPNANPSDVVKQIETQLQTYNLPKDVTFEFTGEMQEMAENMNFLMMAFVIGIAILLLIIVAQFNSVTKPIIILLAIVLSLIGVLYGMVILNIIADKFNIPEMKQSFIILMTMLGIISLAGIVVNNAIVLIDYTQLVIDRKKHELGLEDNENLTVDEYRDAIIEGGTARLRPVLLTAITTILGLLPLTFGLNINFISLLSKFDADIFIGGDNTIFWQPMTLVIINGLTFATFLTLIVVPVLFFLLLRGQIRFAKPHTEEDIE